MRYRILETPTGPFAICADDTGALHLTWVHGSDDELARKVTGDLETLMDETFILGSPEECLEQIEEYKEMGFTDVIIRLFYPEMSQAEALEHIGLVGEEVIPEMHRL